MTFETLRMRIDGTVCFLTLARDAAGNAINRTLVDECHAALDQGLTAGATVFVVEGQPDVFCTGADFGEIGSDAEERGADPETLYELWQRLAAGPFVSLAHVRGKAQAGGVGFAAACDIVVADDAAQFSLPEMLFSLFPACVLPFLVRRIGVQRAHYMTLTTRPVAAQQALEWGLVDVCGDDSEDIVRTHLLRLRRLPADAIRDYKAYMNALAGPTDKSRPAAVAANARMFSDPRIVDGIRRYARTGLFPWED